MDINNNFRTKVADSNGNIKKENGEIKKPLKDDNKLKLSLFDRHVKKLDDEDDTTFERIKSILIILFYFDKNANF